MKIRPSDLMGVILRSVKQMTADEKAQIRAELDRPACRVPRITGLHATPELDSLFTPDDLKFLREIGISDD
jgi:hypothetical protein